MMDINDVLKQKNMTKYRLSKISGVPFTTISEITTGKTKIKNCTGETLYRLTKALDVTMEDILADSMEYRQSFETFKSKKRYTSLKQKYTNSKNRIRIKMG